MLACGVDLVAVARIERVVARFDRRFLDRIYTPAEQARCGGDGASLAGRWAAKEAVGKALGCGIGDVEWTEIEIEVDGRGAPRLRLHGAAARIAAEQGLVEWALSISHDDGRAIALAVASGGGR